MSRDIAPFGLRMKADLKERLYKNAKENKRSLNAELIARLESTLVNTDKFIPAEKAREAAVHARSQIKERILAKCFRDIHEGIQAGINDIYLNLSEFRLDEVDDDVFDELVSLAVNKLDELGYEHEFFDASIHVKF